MDSPLRILHVVVNMNRGGAETLIMNLYRNINREKVQFDFLTFKSGVFDQEIIDMGGRIHRIPYITDVGHIKFTHGLERFFKENNQYKIIHSHMDKMTGFILKHAKHANIPIRIAHSHNTESEGKLLIKIYKWYAGTHIKTSATHLYACSTKAAKWLFKDKASNAHILKNGIETERFIFSNHEREKIRNELNIKKDDLVIGHVGRFNHQKNHLTLLDMFAEIYKKIPNTSLVLVGDGPLRKEIELKISNLKLTEKVKLLGVRPNTNQLLQAFDLFIMPSLHEGLPVTLIEAQGTGLSCIISNHITKEVDMGLGLVQYLPLKNQRAWINTATNLLKITEKPRKIPQMTLFNKGYDIKHIADETAKTYLLLGEKTI